MPEAVIRLADRAAALRVAVHLSEVSIAYQLKDGGRYEAVAPATLSVSEGELVSIVGPTGCGKSTLLNAAAGLIKPSSGRVEIFGQPLGGINTQAGYLFQQDALMPWKTAVDNVAIGLRVAGTPRRHALQTARGLLRQVGRGLCRPLSAPALRRPERRRAQSAAVMPYSSGLPFLSALAVRPSFGLDVVVVLLTFGCLSGGDNANAAAALDKAHVSSTSFARPVRSMRSSSVSSRSRRSIARGSENAERASSNMTQCSLAIFAALRSSHSN
jgi:ABC-type sugar transport system ATPase subunit